MSESGKIIRPEDQSAKKWSIPKMNSTSSGVFRNEEIKEEEKKQANMPTAKDLEQWRKDAHEEGYKEGLKKAENEVIEVKRRLLNLINFLESPLKLLNEEVEQQLNLLAVTLAQQLVKREIKAEPGEIIGVIREAVQMLPASSRKITIHLNPADAELVKSTLTLDKHEDDLNWRLIEDPMMSRGGCEIKSANSIINASLEKRLQALAASILGGEREEDKE